MKARFFAIISHDLRSPIASLINFLNLQQEAPDLLSPEQATQHQQKITESAETLLETMETLLLWSKEQMAIFKPNIQTTRIASLFDYIQKSFGDTLSVQVTFSNPENLTLLTDENYLQTIMYNLTSNAIKALKLTSNASLEWKAFQENNHTILSITDNGPGIQEAAIQILTQESPVFNTRQGLGLHLVRDLAKAIQCPLIVQTKPMVGTTIYLYRT
ncbi:sensor histidine kinase [Xanthocytophaga flava]|uniref:sensor histidine kinase n=1 Tax=Xanthocytophaga flava TaxID=3048013 RepID=UPI0028D85E0F|nr:HAMP domain-containing sensor histidine kinase [Xanthocytophaga flavus]MDJ1470788.1 HAMP domain-containing sensor histidine kinase [Xanthocytophaga flavus]